MTGSFASQNEFEKSEKNLMWVDRRKDSGVLLCPGRYTCSTQHLLSPNSTQYLLFISGSDFGPWTTNSNSLDVASLQASLLAEQFGPAFSIFVTLTSFSSPPFRDPDAIKTVAVRMGFLRSEDDISNGNYFCPCRTAGVSFFQKMNYYNDEYLDSESLSDRRQIVMFGSLTKNGCFF